MGHYTLSLLPPARQEGFFGLLVNFAVPLRLPTLQPVFPKFLQQLYFSFLFRDELALRRGACQAILTSFRQRDTLRGGGIAKRVERFEFQAEPALGVQKGLLRLRKFLFDGRGAPVDPVQLFDQVVQLGLFQPQLSTAEVQNAIQREVEFLHDYFAPMAEGLLVASARAYNWSRVP